MAMSKKLSARAGRVHLMGQFITIIGAFSVEAERLNKKNADEKENESKLKS